MKRSQMQLLLQLPLLLHIGWGVCGEDEGNITDKDDPTRVLTPLRLEDIFPENETYDKMAPPKENGNATVVLFHVTVMSLDSIDESAMTFEADVFFGQSWKDNRLRLPQNMNTSSSSYRLLPVSWLKDMWRPDSFFKNAKSVTFQDMTIPNHYIWLYGDRRILYMVKLTLVLSCAMNFKTYPHDTQKCTMKIESLSHTTADLVFEWDPELPLDVNPDIQLPQLDLVHNSTGDCTTTYLTGNFSCREVIFVLKRRLGYYLFHTYVPTCLIVIMSWISFWIKPEAVPARVTLGVTSLLTLSTQHANSQKSLPPVSYIKAIDIFMSTCTIFVFLSLMEYAFVNILMGDFADEKSVSRTRSLRTVRVCYRDGRYRTDESGSGFGGPEDTRLEFQNEVEGPKEPNNVDVAENRRRKALLIDRISRYLFPTTFAVFNFAYWNISLFILDVYVE